MKNVPNPESGDPVAQSHSVRTGGAPDSNLDRVADSVGVAKDNLEEVVKRSIPSNGGGTNKRNANFEVNPQDMKRVNKWLHNKESNRVQREVKDPGQHKDSGKEFQKFFHKIFNDVKQVLADFNKLPRKEKRTTQVTNYRTAKRHAEEEPKRELNFLERFLSDWLVDAPIDSKIVKRDASSLQGLIERFLAADKMWKRLKEPKVDKRYAEESNEREPSPLDRFLTTLRRSWQIIQKLKD